MPKCKECKDKFEQYEFNNKWCKKIECQTAKAIDFVTKKKKEQKRIWKKKKDSLRPFTHSKENKSHLQSEINKLSKMIDRKFGYINCIDCGKNLEHTDAGHYIAVGANATLRYNLHNIHSQLRGCNRNERQGSRNTGYYKGLVERYGIDYAEMVDMLLQNKYKYLGLKEQEIYDKLKLVRGFVRNFDTYKLEDSISSRNMFNLLIGIYE